MVLPKENGFQAESQLSPKKILRGIKMDKISTKNKAFVDNYGRERMFRGFNIVDKTDYDGGKDKLNFNFDDAFFNRYKQRGFNILRLGFFWDAIEPQPGKYNEPLLDDIDRILDKCAEHGIFVYLDIHQDCYSSAVYGGGAPAWATMNDGIKPRKAKFVWAEGYFISRAVHRAFDNFWENKEHKGKGLLDYYADMWAHMAERFKDKPALFGFDFLNEPYPGKDGGKVFRKLIFKLIRVTLFDRGIKRGKLIGDFLNKKRRPLVLNHYEGEIFKKITSVGYPLIKKFDLERYSPFLNKMTEAVRSVTDNGIVFMDNSYWSNIGIPCSNLPIEVNGEREPNQCFQPHGYDLMVDTPAYKYANNSRAGVIFAEHKRTQDRLNVPVMVGEWGGGGEGTEWFPHVEFLLETFEGNKWSYTYWQYFNGVLDAPLSDLLDRPYPEAVTGEIKKLGFSASTGEFELNYEQDREFVVPTVIYVPDKIKKVETAGEYEVQPIDGSDSCKLIIKTGIGSHTVRVSI